MTRSHNSNAFRAGKRSRLSNSQYSIRTLVRRVRHWDQGFVNCERHQLIIVLVPCTLITHIIYSSISCDRKAPAFRAIPKRLAHAAKARVLRLRAVILAPARDLHDAILLRVPERRAGPGNAEDAVDVVDEQRGAARGELTHREDVGEDRLGVVRAVNEKHVTLRGA